MKILLYYFKTQKTKIIECGHVEVCAGGIFWINKEGCGIIGYDFANYTIAIVNE